MLTVHYSITPKYSPVCADTLSSLSRTLNDIPSLSPHLLQWDRLPSSPAEQLWASARPSRPSWETAPSSPVLDLLFHTYQVIFISLSWWSRKPLLKVSWEKGHGKQSFEVLHVWKCMYAVLTRKSLLSCLQSPILEKYSLRNLKSLLHCVLSSSGWHSSSWSWHKTCFSS